MEPYMTIDTGEWKNPGHSLEHIFFRTVYSVIQNILDTF